MLPDILDEEVQAASRAYDDMTNDRHGMGEDKYGHLSHLSADTFEMALEELADLGNYVRYTYIKLYLLRDRVRALTAQQSGVLGATVVNPYQRREG